MGHMKGGSQHRKDDLEQMPGTHHKSENSTPRPIQTGLGVVIDTGRDPKTRIALHQTPEIQGGGTLCSLLNLLPQFLVISLI